MYLYHPTVPGAMLVVYWDAMERRFYIREPREGVGCPLDELPLVHSFPLEGRAIFPDIVEYAVEEDRVRYVWEKEEDGSIAMMVPRDQYERLKFLFDDKGEDAKNPIPWEERYV